jgi:integrase
VAQRRGFGSIRRLPSGRWQARFTHPRTGQLEAAPSTFATKADANRWLSSMESDLDRGEALDLNRAKQTFGSYGQAWLDSRGDLRPKTMELYEYLFRVYLKPRLGARQIGRVDSEIVRQWYGEASSGTQSKVTTAKAYRLLRQILQSAVDDRLLRTNPCNLKGAAVERSKERPILSIDEVMALADAIKPRYRLMVLLAGLVGLRRGECLALRVHDLEQRDGRWRVTVDSSTVYVGGVARRELPKTEAGTRRLALPAAVGAAVEQHVAEFGLSGDELLFADPRTGATPTITVWRRVWDNARRDTGIDCTFHDLRHHAGTLTASAGASIRESMARLGHASPRAALRYQHAAEQRDVEVASSIDRLIPESA